MAIYKIPEFKFHNFKKALQDVNKKLAKYGTKVEILEVVDQRVDSNGGFSGQVHFLKKIVRLSEPAVTGKPGVKFLGIATFIDGIPAIYASEDSSGYALRDYAEQTFSCDHCHSTRFRTKLFFFLENGEVRRIGSSCVKEWFGLDLEKIFSIYEIFTTNFNEGPDEEDDWGMPGANLNPTYIDPMGLVALVAAATHSFQISWQPASSGDPTVGKIKRILERDHPDPQLESVSTELCEKALAKAVAMWNIVPSSDFEFNIISNMFTQGVLRTSIPIARLGTVAWAIWKANQNVTESAKTIGANEYLGAVGEKITFTAQPRVVYSYEARYAYNSSTVNRILVFTTPIGDVKWSTTMDLPADSDGEYLVMTLTGKIKSLEEYNGRKQTVVTRCKLVS